MYVLKYRRGSTRRIAIGVATFLLAAPAGGWLLALQKVPSRGTTNSPATDRSPGTAVKGAKTKTDQPKTITKTTSVTPTNPKSTSNNSAAPSSAAQGLLWEEDFTRYTAATPSSARWNIANSSTPIYNDEAQVYQPGSSTVRVANGALSLQAIKQGNGIISGMIDTRNKLSISVGTRLEAHIRLPSGKGTWPAFWLLSQNQPHTSALRPTSADWEKERFYMWDGEIDIMEAYGKYTGMVESTVHTFDTSVENDLKLPDPTGWHTYWMEWRSETLKLGVDSITLLTYQKQGKGPSSWPMTDNNKYYVILNLAMGGTGGGTITSAPGDRWQMDVSRVAAYKL